MSYAQNTYVSVDRSEAEIKQTLLRYKADKFFFATEKNRAVVGFQIGSRCIQIAVPMPDRSSTDFTLTPSGRQRKYEEDITKSWEQACRQRWRALALVLKAKLESVEAGISTLDNEFLAFMVLPGGKTFGEWATPQLDTIYSTGKAPKLLTMGGE